MRTALKWIGRGVLGLLALLGVGTAAVYALSEWKLNRTYEVADIEAIDIPTDSASIAEGERLARTRGCYEGCHGEAAEGGVFFEDPLFGTATAPDLTRAVHTLSPEQLVGAIRYGVLSDGRTGVAMPSRDFYHLTDDDLGAILAFLRSLPRTEGPEANFRAGPLARALFATGQFEPVAEQVDREAARLDPGNGGDPAPLGEYVAVTACAECHGPRLEGSEGPPNPTPNLRITSAYSSDEFRTLMRTGTPRDGRDLRLMDDVSRKRFSHLTEAEIDGLYVFLTEGLAPVAEETAVASD